MSADGASASGAPVSGAPASGSTAPQVNPRAAGWDERYADDRYLFGERPNDFLVESEIMLPRRSRLLVIGDGEGRNGVWLASRGHAVTTVDLSAVGVRKARALAERKGVYLDAHVADLDHFLDDPASAGPWDGVVSIFCHLPPELRARVGRVLTQRLSDRGRLLLEGYTPAQLSLGTGGPKDESVMFTRDRIEHDWPDLALDIRMVERRIFEGPGHQGLSAVIQVLGQPRR